MTTLLMTAYAICCVRPLVHLLIIITKTKGTSVIWLSVHSSRLLLATSRSSSGREKHRMTTSQVLGFCITQPCSL